MQVASPASSIQSRGGPIDTANRHASCGARRGDPSARPALFALFACAIACAGATSPGRADTRFGDSTWVAPGAPRELDSATAGPRIAAHDRERRWETALRTPGRVVFFPLRLVARGIEAGVGFAGPRLFEPKPVHPNVPGPSLGPWVLASGIDDIGIGPAFRWDGFPAADAKLLLAASWSAIDRRHVHFSETFGAPRPVGLVLRADYDRKPNHRYYGIGNETSRADLSYFLLATTSADATLRLGASRLRQVRIAGGYSGMSPRSGYNGSPLLADAFAPGSVPFERQETRELWYGVAADLASLDDARDPSRGVHGRVDVRRVSGLGASDPDFDEWRLEARAYLPVFAKRRVVAVRAVYAGVEPGGPNTTSLPFYRLALGEGTTRFAGYAAERFRDRQLLLGRIEYRWEVLYRLSAVALYELGEVAPRTGAFSLRRAHPSHGGGLRLGLSDVAVLRLEFAASPEGLQSVLSWEGDF
jgi:hypothetical protein